MIKRKLYLVYSLMLVLLLSACLINKTEDKSIITENSNSTVIDTSVNSSINVSEDSVSKDNSVQNNNSGAPDTFTERPSEVTQNKDNNNFNFSKGYFKEKDIAELFNLTKKQIELLIGKEYEIIETGAEESFTSYKYSKHDISIYYITNDTVEDTSDDNVDFIQCGKKIDFNKVHIGMEYKQIKEIFPNAVIKSWSPEEDNEIVYYQIEFYTNNFNVKLKIQDKNSPTTSMTIYRK